MKLFLQVGDLTGFSFFLAAMALLAATAFFYWNEIQLAVSGNYRSPLPPLSQVLQQFTIIT